MGSWVYKLDINIEVTHNHIMTKLIVEIDETLNKEFRDAILATKGWNKGVIKEALREAIECWIRESKSKAQQ